MRFLPSPFPRPSLRPSRRITAVAAAAATVGMSLLAVAPAHAAEHPAAGPVATHRQAVTAAQQRSVLQYWTPERIAALTTPTSGNPPAGGPDGAPWTTGGALPGTVGRLFFTDHGEDSSCTATVIRSANRSTVVTAGHCVNNTDLLGENNQWAANEMFVPGYHDGQAPYGKFVGRMGVVGSTWLANDQQHAQTYDSYDQAFVVLNTDERGRRLQDAVGTAQRIGFDRPGDVPSDSFGYPRASADPAREGLPEYTGERLAYCSGTAREYPGTVEFPEPPGLFGPPCVMGGGSSGGPRITGLNPVTGVGTVVGDNTQSAFFETDGAPCADSSHDGCVRYLVGPQFSTAITEPLYDRAQRA
ncbi:trypsin-like serine peptidase [Streptomyces sp. NPDC057900]|uniref:trypsin-like serine peptidase n=1 Tax=Streptomyces sp. NPDC057900 TaxID=3346274 RepID=UPI0036E3B205